MLRPMLRRLILRVLRRVNPGDISIRHHHTGEKIRLHSFKHRGYWYKGKRRETRTIEVIEHVLHPGDVVLEAGGHIGYLSLIFCKCVGENGRVFVFEPGLNNLEYIRANLASQKCASLEEKAVSNKVGEATFYEECLTGQNNSLVSDYDVLNANVAASGLVVKVETRQVPTTTLDHFVSMYQLKPNFVKIDIEGAEWLAIQGARGLLQEARPLFMVEITSHSADIVQCFRENDYRLFTEDGREVASQLNKVPELLWNTFAVPVESAALSYFLTRDRG